MSQPSVTAYFATRKRPAGDDLRAKAKVLLLEQEDPSRQVEAVSHDESEKAAGQDEMGSATPKIILRSKSAMEEISAGKATHNVQVDSSKTNAERTPIKPRRRTSCARRLLSMDGQADIRDSFQKLANIDEETKKVPFEKRGMLSPKKPKKDCSGTLKDTAIKEAENEQPAAGSVTPKKRASTMESLANDNLSFDEIKNRINKSSRLMELKASIERIKSCNQRLQQMQKRNDVEKPQMQKFEKIELEIPVSPQKEYKSPTKALLTPTKDLSKMASPQRRLLFEPKEMTPSPVKGSPTKKPAYQKYLSIVESRTPSLVLPYDYRFLAEAFRAVDTVSAMLFNRKELITFNKLKPAVQQLLRRNFTLEHLAQVKTIYPDAYTYHQEKHRNFGSTSKQEKYELVLMPVVEANNGRNTPEADDILKTASASSMGPTILLDRRRKFYNILLERVKDEHEKFLLSLETPMVIPKDKIMRWHPEFDVEVCNAIEQAELPQPPHIEKTTAKDVLDKAKSLFNCGTRMEKALQRLAEANMTSKSVQVSEQSSTEDLITQNTEDNIRKVDIAIIETPPITPATQKNNIQKALKGIPKALLEKVRAKQAAKALEAMTRTPNADKEAALYSRLPELSKILRNIFVAEKKGVLLLEIVIQKLDNSFRMKLTPQEIEEHVRLLCKLLPTWTSIHNVRKMNYLKLDRNVDIAKVIKRLEIFANNKVKAS